MRRLVVSWVLLAVAAALPACKSDRDRADELGAKGNLAIAAHDYPAAAGFFDQALKLAPLDYAYLGRAEALLQIGKGKGEGGEEQAAASLKGCETEPCIDKRQQLGKSALERLGDGPFSDQAGLQRFLRLKALAGQSPTCALLTAIGRAGDVNDGQRKLLAAAVQTQIDDLTKQLGGGKEAGGPSVRMARALGASVADAKDCEEMGPTRMKMLGSMQALAEQTGGEANTDRADVVFDLGLLSAKRQALARSPKAVAALAAAPLWSPADLTAYLDGLTKAGYDRPCAVFMAIVRAERLPPGKHAALKAPLGAAIASVAPAKEAAAESKEAGRVLRGGADISSGAQTCDELDSFYEQISSAMANAAALVGGEAPSGTEASGVVDRPTFIYRALRARFEHPMSKEDIRQQAELKGHAELNDR
jgi:hypothetical protein